MISNGGTNGGVVPMASYEAHPAPTSSLAGAGGARTSGGVGATPAMGARMRHQPTSSDSFAQRLLAPASHWYDEMRWSRKHHSQMTKGKRLEVSVSEKVEETRG